MMSIYSTVAVFHPLLTYLDKRDKNLEGHSDINKVLFSKKKNFFPRDIFLFSFKIFTGWRELKISGESHEITRERNNTSTYTRTLFSGLSSVVDF